MTTYSLRWICKTLARSEWARQFLWRWNWSSRFASVLRSRSRLLQRLDMAINVSVTCISKTWLGLWRDPFLSLSPCGWPQASSRAAVLPPPHAEQTQTTAAGLFTWHPARPRHARGICAAHARKYGDVVLFTPGSYSIRAGRRIHAWQKHSLMNESNVSNPGFSCQLSSHLQIEKEVRCVMGIPGPVHSPSCSTAQVRASVHIPRGSVEYIFLLCSICDIPMRGAAHENEP